MITGGGGGIGRGGGGGGAQAAMHNDNAIALLRTVQPTITSIPSLILLYRHANCGGGWQRVLSDIVTNCSINRLIQRASSAASAALAKSAMIVATGSSLVTMPTDCPAISDPFSMSPSITARRNAPAQ